MRSAAHWALPLLLASTLACRTTDDGRIGDGPDDTANENCPGCFDAAGFIWTLQTGLQDGQMAAVHTAGGDREPALLVQLAEPRFFDEDPEIAGDPADTCQLEYSFSLQPGATAPAALLDWELSPQLESDGCGELDPDWSQVDLVDDFASWTWELVGEALQSSQATTLESWFDENDADWATEGAPYYFGLFSWFDGTPIVADFQNHYGRAYAVDADMNILLEEAGGSLLSTEQVGEGSDGWYEIYAFTWLSVSEDLP